MYTRRDWIIGAGSLGLASLLPASAPPATDWPQFRGSDRTNISKETGLARKWPAAGPKTLWSVPVAQGYAAAAIVAGRVYHHDYDEKKSEWCVNCRSLSDGKLIWQFREAREIRPNHAITRTVPAVDGRFVVSLDPKAVLHCLDAKTGKQLWRKSLVTEYKAAIPPWYNGQNPLLEAGPHHHRHRRRRHPGGARQTHRQGNLAHAESRPAPDVALLRHARRTRRSQAVSLRHAQRPARRQRQGRQTALAVPAQVQCRGGAIADRRRSRSASS